MMGKGANGESGEMRSGPVYQSACDNSFGEVGGGEQKMAGPEALRLLHTSRVHFTIHVTLGIFCELVT